MSAYVTKVKDVSFVKTLYTSKSSLYRPVGIKDGIHDPNTGTFLK